MIRSIVFASVLATFAGLPCAQDRGGNKPATKIDFQQHVWPILEQRCIECHATAKPDENGRLKRPKGGVTLDTKEGILASKKGKVVVAKKPKDSLIVASISLPADDEDRMPPAKKGDPLTKEQIETIRTWIEQGADFGKWTGKEKEKDKEKGGKDKEQGGDGGQGKDAPGSGRSAGGGEARWFRLAAGLEPADPAALAAAAALPCHIEPVAPGSPLLSISFFGHEAAVTGRTLQALEPLRQHIAELNLARSGITDQDCRTLQGLPRLVRLDLRQTRIGDDGLTALASLPELRTLNLVGTRVGDRGLAALADCARLQQLYVWQTDVTATAVVALREKLPEARLVFTADLPEPMAGDAARPRSRR